MDVLSSRVFMNGNSQAVRIPAEFRFSSDRVQITRSPSGDLIIHPCPLQRGQALLDTLAGFDSSFDSSFVSSLEEHQANLLPVQERDTF
jgi:antitoxin VapB